LHDIKCFIIVFTLIQYNILNKQYKCLYKKQNNTTQINKNLYKIMKEINANKYIYGKKKLGKGKRGQKGEMGSSIGAFGGKSKFNKKRLDKES